MNISIKIQIEVETPIHIGTGLGISGVIDRAIIKDSERDVYIPGSTIKGRIKYNYTLLYPFLSGGRAYSDSSSYCMKEDIKTCCAVCQIFGSKLHGGLFVFQDALLIKDELKGLSHGNRLKRLSDFKPVQTIIRKGIKISRLRRVAEEKKLFAIETSSPYFVYETEITGSFYPAKNNKAPIPPEIAILLLSIKELNKIGGSKSRGLGNINVNIAKLEVNSQELDNNQVNQLLIKLVTYQKVEEQ